MLQNTTNDLVNRLIVRDYDLKGRRVINAASAQNPGDYVTKADLDNAIASISQPPDAQWPTIQKDQTLARLFTKVYHNNFTRPILVSISVTCNKGDQATAYTDTRSTPLIPVCTVAANIGAGTIIVDNTMTFVVLPNHYYELKKTTGNPTFGLWIEWS